MPNADEAKGRMKEATGAVTGDDDLKREGKVDQASGKLQKAMTDAADKVKGLLHKR